MYKSMAADGGKIRVTFDHVGGGLVARGGELKTFQIAGEDHKFVWADAKVDGETVVVSNDKVAKAVAVRYAWADNPEGCNLYNKEGIPASPFRTDDWAGLTAEKK
jgi:sialate O-acetylesterase